LSSKIPPYQAPSPFIPFLRRFTDERAHELSETIALYNEVRTAHLATHWSKEQTLDRVSDFIAGCVADVVELPDSQTIGAAFDRCQRTVLALETTIFSSPKIDWDIAKLSLKEQVDLRRFLRAQQHFLANADRVADQLATTLGNVIGGIIAELPELPESTDDPIFSVPLISLVRDPGDLVDGIIGTISKEELAGAGLFTTLQQRLYENVCLASGVAPDDERNKPLITADESTLAPQELVETYLGGTPFRDLLLTLVPFSIPETARFEHTHILAGTGHGKTQLMQLSIYHDLLHAKEDGRSVIVIDSQGDMIRTISNLALFRPNADGSLADRLLIIDPNDVEYPACLNMFDWNRDRLP
jgi:Helicase HerA, central domain